MGDDVVYSSVHGDLRKKKNNVEEPVDEMNINLSLRRLTSGKGRTVIEITGLPNNKSWCKNLAKDLKKKLGVGGAFKNNFIEVHGEKYDEVASLLESRKLAFKRIGG
tara:strand:- start:20 stop:340 length:321 start_codon:yes stop_codon:yes gene_type:complete